MVAAVYLGGKRTAQRSIDLAARSALDQEFSCSPPAPGILGGYVEIDDDLFEVDNRRYFTLSVPERITVLLVGEPMATSIPLLALSLGGDTTLAGHLSVERVSEASFSSANLEPVDVVILCGLKGPSFTAAHRIGRFVKSGGGVVIFPGPESSPEVFNQHLAPVLGLPRWTGGPVSQPEGGFLTFAKVDFSHPVFEGMFDVRPRLRAQQPAIESPRIRRALPLAAGERGESVIGLSNGSPFLAEYQCGSGRVMAFAVEPQLTWSDFPVKGIFAPLLHRCAMYLAAQSATAAPITAGEPIRVTARLRGFTDRDTYSLLGPGGDVERIVPHFLTASGSVRFEAGPAQEPGVYYFRRERQGEEGYPKVIHAVAVNVDPLESDLRTASDRELSAFWETAGIREQNVRRMSADQPVAEGIRQARYGIELCKHLITLTLLLALAEMAIGRAPKPQAESPQRP
jgi:hypothetical protein